MSYALVLTAGKAAPLTPDLARKARDAAVAAGARVSVPRWLAPGEACEMDCDCNGILGACRDALAPAPVDVNLVPMADRRKRLLVADMDSTIITVECIDEIADMAGLKPQVAAITERAMRGELVFEEALRARVALLKDLPEAALARVYDERVRLMPGARTLVATMAAHGAPAVLVSGGFTFFTARVAADVGFAEQQGNTLETAEGRLTGTVAEPILGRDAKRARLQETAGRLGLAPEQTLAVGDGANDLDMLRAAGLGVAFRAKPVVAEAASARIDHGDLTALLYLQGYAAADLVAD